jgi:hypothetical protein
LAALLGLGIFLVLTFGGSTGSLPGFSLSPTPTPTPSAVAASPTLQLTPTDALTSTNQLTSTNPLTPTSGPVPFGQPSDSSGGPPFIVYLPVVGGLLPAASVSVAEVATPTTEPTALPTDTPIPVQPTTGPNQAPSPIPPRGPIRITKLGLGVYNSGGGMLPAMDEARPSVIVLMDASVGFAQEVRKHFPQAFIIGRIYTASQPLDNPAQRGSDFADRVAISAVPLKGVVDAWMSYNEIAAASDPQGMTNYDIFQVAFAHRLQDYYGIPAVAGNDGPRAIPAALYPQYFGDAIRVSKYFGFHLYPEVQFRSLRDPAAAGDVFYYRQIHAALVAAGIQSGPFIATEAGLYNGWRGVEDDTNMGNDFVWLADQMNSDPYVLGFAIFGLFQNGQWPNFEIFSSNIGQTIGDYNTVH